METVHIHNVGKKGKSIQRSSSNSHVNKVISAMPASTAAMVMAVSKAGRPVVGTLETA